jgi:tetratricopeptide (TPR) repeat protein
MVLNIHLRVTATLLAALLCAAPGGGAVAAQPWKGNLTRAEALRDTGSGQLERRRHAYLRLADVGTMEDIPLLLSALRDEEDLIRGVAEQVIWGIWMRTGDSVADPMFQTGLQLMQEKNYRGARDKLSEVIELKPEFAEAWNRRAEANVLLDRWDDAFADFHKALELNPYHFGALEGMGHCRLNRNDPVGAVGYFRRAIEINPNLWDVYEALQRAEAAAEKSRT